VGGYYFNSIFSFRGLGLLARQSALPAGRVPRGGLQRRHDGQSQELLVLPRSGAVCRTHHHALDPKQRRVLACDGAALAALSPEASVVEVLIESAVMLERDREAVFYLQRYKAAFPEAHARWAARSASNKAP